MESRVEMFDASSSGDVTLFNLSDGKRKTKDHRLQTTPSLHYAITPPFHHSIIPCFASVDGAVAQDYHPAACIQEDIWSRYVNAWERLCQIVRANFPWHRADELIDELEAHFAADPEIDVEPRGTAGRSSYSRPSTKPGVEPVLAGYYANLEIPYGAGAEKARQAWKNLLKMYHPDLHHDDPEKRRIANELTSQLTRAYREIDKAHNR
jgi:hypothetical protein